MESQPVRIEELLAHAGWVRKLAVRLVRDAGTADDVAQEVWAHALRSPPRDRSNLRAWLSAAVRNSARSLKRAEVRRADREAVVEIRHEEPPTSEIVERAQLHRHLVEQVLALEEPQRSIVLAHWFEGQSLAEIARRQHMTERVVKTRLEAGHALLRQRLDKSPGGRSAWCLAFTKWIGPSLAPAGAGTAVTVGGLFMASKLVIVSSVVVAAAVGWFVWPTPEPQPSVASASSTPEIVVPDPINESKELVEAHTSSARESLAIAAQSNPAAAAAAATETRWVVRGHVRGAPAGRETETKLTASCIGLYNIRRTAGAVAQRDGTFEIDLTDVVKSWLLSAEPSEVHVLAEHPLCSTVQTIMSFESARIDNTSAAICHEFRCDFTLEAAATVTGRVVVPADSKPEPGRLELVGAGEERRAWVSLFDFSKSALSNEGLDHAQSDGDGNWILRTSRSGTFTVIAHREGLRPTAIVVNLALGQAVDVGVVALEHGSSISGTVRRNGQSIGAGARVVAKMKSQSPPSISFPSQAGATYLHASSNGFDWAQVRTLTRSDGTYSFGGLASAEYELRVEGAPRVRAALGGRQITERTVLAPQSGVDLEGVPPTIELVLKVDGRAPTNADLEGVVVIIAALSDGSVRNDINLTGSAHGYGKIQLGSGTAYELRVPPGRYAPKVVAIGALEAGDERMLPLDLVTQDVTGTLVVRFVSDESRDLPAAQFAFQDLADSSGTSLNWRREKRSRSGEFVLRESPSGNWHVRVRPFDSVGIGVSDHFIATEFDVTVPAKGTVEREVRLDVGGRLRVSAKNELGGFVRTPVELRNAHNEKIPTEFYCRAPASGAAGCGWYLCEMGINDHPPLPAGHYELTLSAPDFAKQVVPFDLVGGETKTLEVVLRPR